MKCSNCKKKGIVKLSYTKREYCKACFLKLIEKRIRKELRKSKELKAKEKVLLLNDGSKEYFISRYFLQNIFGKNIEIKEVKVSKHFGSSSKNNDLKKLTTAKTIIPWNMDRELNIRLEEYFTNKKRKRIKNYVYLLKNVLDDELLIIAKLLKLKAKKDHRNEFIEKVEARYPGIKFSLYKSFENLKPEAFR